MFHIFRWRRDRRNENTTPSDTSTDQENKKSHSRHHRFRMYHGRQPFERLFHIRRHRSPVHHNKQQVINYHFKRTYSRLDFHINISKRKNIGLRERK